MRILEASHLFKYYTAGSRNITVLDDVSFSVSSGESLVIEGESGSGKSTLLSILSGLDQPDEGRIAIDSKEITNLAEDQLASLRNLTFGFVFQSYHLIPSLTALENVMFPAELRSDPLARDKAEKLLGRVGLAERLESFPHQLSGGEKQRCAICRALINDPRIIFADEPTGNLDSINGRAILNLLLELHHERRTTLILVTHSPEIAQNVDRVITLRDGKITKDTGHA